MVWDKGGVSREDDVQYFPYREPLEMSERVKHSHDFLVAAEAEGLDEDAAYDALGVHNCLRGPDEKPDPVQSAKDIVSGKVGLSSSRLILTPATDTGTTSTLADGATVRRAARRTEDDSDVGC